jgi:carbon storage regulator
MALQSVRLRIQTPQQPGSLGIAKKAEFAHYFAAPGKEFTMLVLSRQRDQTIMIGDDVEITVVDIRGEKVRLGINAPPHIPVHRKEVYDAIRQENAAKAKSNGGEPHAVESLAEKKKSDGDSE